MNDALPIEGKELLLGIISELPSDFNLSAEIRRAEISNRALAGGRSCDIYCAKIPWVSISNNAVVISRCRATENEKRLGVLKVAIKRARSYILNTNDRDGLLKFVKVRAGVHVDYDSYDVLCFRDMHGRFYYGRL